MERQLFKEMLARTLHRAQSYGADFYKLAEKRDSLKTEGDIKKALKEIGHENFRRKCNEGYKLAQQEILEAILKLEEEVRSARNDEESGKAKYYIAALKEVCNVIAWALLNNERAHVRSLLIENMGSGFLTDRNIASVIATAEETNKDGDRFALITDITSCVGLGDLMEVSVGGAGVSFVEVKEGKVNEEVVNFIETKIDGYEPQVIAEELARFEEKHGAGGV